VTATEAANIELVRSYLEAVEHGMSGKVLAAFYTEDALQIEMPNRLNANGGSSDLTTLLKRAEQASVLLQRQSCEIQSIVAQGACVAVEATWIGVLAIAAGSLAAGSSMKAHFAIFFELRDGRIYRQRNYDCFEPW
jgi:ketosteroid isomerase-like protein